MFIQIINQKKESAIFLTTTSVTAPANSSPARIAGFGIDVDVDIGSFLYSIVLFGFKYLLVLKHSLQTLCCSVYPKSFKLAV